MRMTADRAQAALLRALRPITGECTAIAARSTPWSSATFEGARHRLALRLDGADADARGARLVAMLPEAEIALRGAFVADLLATLGHDGEAPVLGIEALTIDEC